jgi:hypothetical protein
MNMLIVSDYVLGDESCHWMKIASSAKMALYSQLVKMRYHLAPTYLAARRCVELEVHAEE